MRGEEGEGFEWRGGGGEMEGEEVLDVEQLLSLLVILVVVVLFKDLLSLVTNYLNQCVELVFFY